MNRSVCLHIGAVKKLYEYRRKKVPQEKRYLLTKQIYGLAVDSAFIVFVFIVDVCDKPSSRTLQIIQSNISFCGL